MIVRDETYGDHCGLDEVHDTHWWDDEQERSWYCMGTFEKPVAS